jgi:hypothetical protein
LSSATIQPQFERIVFALPTLNLFRFDDSRQSLIVIARMQQAKALGEFCGSAFDSGTSVAINFQDSHGFLPIRRKNSFHQARLSSLIAFESDDSRIRASIRFNFGSSQVTLITIFPPNQKDTCS